MERKIRIVMAKPGLDGHDRGIKVLAAAYRDAGMEVIYLGLRQTPEMIVSAALQEDADVIALSSLNNAHNTIFPRIIEIMKTKELENVLLIGGGIIPKKDIVIRIHFLKLTDSPINRELKIIAIGIDNWAPITIGAKIFDALIDKYKKRFTPAPIEIANPNNGNKYFLLGSFNLIKGKRHINTIAILIEPNKIGGIDSFKPSFAVG